MTFYVDTDAILAVVKKSDHLKKRAMAFFRSQSKDRLVTSSLVLLEVWFYLKKHGVTSVDDCLESARQLVGHVLPLRPEDFDAAMTFSTEFGLTPADSLHVAMALSCEGIVSTDQKVNRVKGLRVIQF